MHRVLALLALLVLAAAVAAAATAPARAAGPTDRKIAALAKQVTALQKQVTALKKDQTALKKQVTSQNQGIALLIAVSACSLAATADALTGTWGIVDTVTPGKVYFGVQPVLNDSGWCKALQVTRSQALPPTLSTFQALLALFQSTVPRPFSPAAGR